jgi:hypothetical protein
MTMSEEQPELRWAPREPAPKRNGRIWLIVGLIVAALVIVGVLLFLFLPRGDAPEPGASETPSASASPSETVVPASPDPSAPVETPPPPAEPDLSTFRGQVQPWLDDALTGLGFIADSGEQEAQSIIDTLVADAQRLSDAQPPSAIATEWRDGVSDYISSLEDVRAAVEGGSDVSGAADTSRSAVEGLRTLVGL